MTPLQAFDLWTPLAEMAPFHVAFLVAVGAAIGFCIGMTAIGGGILAVPALALGFGLDPSVCVGTASLYTFLTKIFSTYRHFKLGTIRYRISAYFLLGAIPGAGIGAWYVNARVGTQDVEARLPVSTGPGAVHRMRHAGLGRDAVVDASQGRKRSRRTV